MDGGEAFLTTLKNFGVKYIFGTPGTTEAPLLDRLAADGELRYVLALHESVAVGMADGLARAGGGPGVANVHTTVGTANSLGMLINSFADEVPVVLTAGLKDHRALGTGVFCEAPSQVTDLTRQYTKWSWQALAAEHLGRDTAKALRLALSPPRGPVFLGIPEDFWLRPADDGNASRESVAREGRGDQASLQAAVGLLQTARAPVMMVGNQVGRSGAQAEAIALAEFWRLPVFNEERLAWAHANFPTDHPLYAGCFKAQSPLVRNADVVLSIGAHLFMSQGYRPDPCFAPGTKVIQIHSDAAALSRDFAAELNIVSGAKAALVDLLACSRTTVASVEGRPGLEWITAARAEREQAKKAALAGSENAPAVKVHYLVDQLSRWAAPDAAVVNEGIRSGFFLQDYFTFTARRSYFGYTGGCLGWGLPAAAGVKLAQPGREVIAFLGDGSFLFVPQALWTIAHYRIGVKIIICNNQGYMAVKGSVGQLKGNSFTTGKYLGADLVGPAVDYTALSNAFGVPAWRAGTPAEVREKMQRFLAEAGPALLEVVLDPADMEKRLD
jgi:benzoylformate decarboxylase